MSHSGVRRDTDLRMRALVLVVVLLSTAVAHAGGSVTPPKGWKREKVDPSGVAGAVLDWIGPVKAVKNAWWQMPLDEYDEHDDGWLMSLGMVATDTQRTPQELADAIAAEMDRTLSPTSTLVPVTAPTIKGQATAARKFEKMTTSLYLQVHAQRGKGGVHVFLVMCSATGARDACKPTMKTIKLVAR